jgi:hypothetical protein
MRHSVLAPAIASALAAFAASADSGKSLRIAIDPGVSRGPVKPVNGVGQPPMVGQLRSWSMMHYLKEAGIPFSRLHDVGGWMGHGLYVDIPNLFPDFDADENDPANYRFAFTDSLLDALVEAGVEPFFRLGVTIENWVSWPGGLPRQRIEPPKNFSKWARICEHVIRHYTEGWANGRRHKISHWEIWNEPDGLEDPETNGMWHGSFADYCRFYETAAKHLKAAFPHLKIGGFGSCGVGKVSCKNWNARDEYHLKCFHDFLAFVRDRGCPLDFLSFHSYSKPEEMRIEIEYVREQLEKAGFADVETCLDEWLPAPTHDKLGTARQAAEIAAALTVFQNGPLDSAAIYDARCGVGDYSPLFNPLTYKPHKAYYAFTAFNKLRQRGTAVGVSCDGPCPEAYSAAAKGADGSLAVMIANPGDDAVPFALEIAGDGRLATASECRITDDDRTDAEIPLPDRLPPHSFLVAIFRQ